MGKTKTLEKVPLQIEAKITPRGDNMPFQLIYEDEIIEIVNPVKSIRLYDGAFRWRCGINGQEVELYNLGEEWWTIQ
ncbi:hypothetical protein [Candidatus Formimonas warabiya]|uniref:Uncharacterized protein n=1 Tax=Formimonas warabiya TaxID=1761012 RepID=A0A3G1KP10_FORW1|nr:hypothetical protein [Candidatus Formimonas warabiya]ATW24198.1 hypothetical protein DCMF_04810 [Candidatus Formimonas warabiya]